jgi:predicted nucleic acid-binding Zn ribbon protein
LFKKQSGFFVADGKRKGHSRKFRKRALTGYGRGHIKSLGAALQSLLSRGRLAQALRTAALRSAWKDTVGDVLAEQTYPLALKKGTLWVAVSSSVVTQELFFEKGKILEGLKERLKKEQIRELRYKVDALPKTKNKKVG